MGSLRLAIVVFISLRVSGADFEAGKAAFAKGDYATAMTEWKPLAEQGLPFAAYNVALLYTKGQGVQKDPAEAAKWYRVAADKGIPEAQYNLGLLYSTGSGVPKDEKQAADWFEKAAQKGDSNAANNIGELYESSEGSLHNPAEAEKWYRKSAEEGNADAQFNLGVMYDLGNGVKIDPKEAYKWYMKAASQWEEGALCNLGILYYNGEGVTRDLIQSHAYYLLAREAGDPRASNLMQLTTEKLTTKQIEKAADLAAQFKTQHAKEIALAKNPIMKPPSKDSVSADAYANLAAPAASGPGVWTGIDRVVAVGDVRGHLRAFTATLQAAGVIDADSNWSGGKTHLVQTGNVVDKGTDSRRIMDLLIKLEGQARAAGGMVHCLIGNHEAMNMYGDLRFVSPAEYQHYATPESAALRDKSYERYVKQYADYAAKNNKPNESQSKEDWMKLHPLGFVEQRAAFEPSGQYGKWILSHDAVIRINDVLYSNSGIGPKYSGQRVEQINKTVHDELASPSTIAGGIVADPQGPLWFKGFAPGNVADPSLDGAMKRFGAAYQVIGHVDAGGAVMPEYGGKVILIDVQLAKEKKGEARQATFLEEKDQLFAVHRGTKLPLPKDNKGMLAYLKAAAALDPEPSPLQPRIQSLQTQ